MAAAVGADRRRGAGLAVGGTLARYVVRRILGAIPLLWGIVTLLFILLHLAPGDPTTAYFNPNVSPDVIEQMRRNFGLDQPLLEQYLAGLDATARNAELDRLSKVLFNPVMAE